MPNRDGTGPRGKGPKTGKGLGKCKEEENEGWFRGFGKFGRGLMRGARESYNRSRNMRRGLWGK